MFPNKQIHVIWANLDLQHIPPRPSSWHRRIFTSIVLHQIHKDKFERVCAVCGLENEDFEHLVLYCPALAEFKEYIETLLNKHYGAQLEVGSEK